MHILLVEDEIDFQKVLAQYLTLSGFEVFTANHGKHGLDVFNQNHIDLCILDVMMPVMDGFTLSERLRRLDPEIPIIFLTAKNQKEDRIKGLKLNADDYITKPFEAEELVLRIQNILRRKTADLKDSLHIGNFSLLMDELKLSNASESYQLTIREAELLQYLSRNKNQVVTRNQVLEDLWGKDDFFLGRSMDVFISRLRKYLKNDSVVKLETIRGVGFILREERK